MAERVSPQQREAEPLRWCIYCDADCSGDRPHDHADWCPSTTNVWPVVAEDRCRHCLQAFPDQRISPYACCACGEPFGKGDHYTHAPTDQSDVFEVVCLGCARPD